MDAQCGTTQGAFVQFEGSMVLAICARVTWYYDMKSSRELLSRIFFLKIIPPRVSWLLPQSHMHRDTIYSFHRSKRNKPCDPCRRQRRKCVPGEQDGRCTRCDQMQLQCTHEYVLTPAAADEAENAEEKARMVHAVAGIEQQMRRIEKEMTTVRAAAGLPRIYSVSALERGRGSQYGGEYMYFVNCVWEIAHTFLLELIDGSETKF